MIEYCKNRSMEILKRVDENGIEHLEEFTPMVGYEDFYEISNFLRVRRLPRLIRNKSALFVSKERIVVSYFSKSIKYMVISLTKNSKKSQMLMHRLMAIHFIPNPENKPDVNHKNGIKTDNRVENLEWCTKSENSQHASKSGLLKIHKGEDSVRSKLNEEQVLKIRELFNQNPKINKSSLAREFKIGNTTLHHILKRNTWKHI